MNKTFLYQRPAIAMIELIFAIVVMGIVMMSAPQLLSTASNSGYVAIQQENISEASAQLNIMLGYQWDENDTNASHTTVLNTTSGNAGLDGTILHPKRRVGTPATSKRLFISYDGDEFNASTIGVDANDAGINDDMDDFNGIATNLTEVEGAGASDYIEKDTIVLSRTVNYMTDAPSGGTYSDPEGDNTILFSPASFATPSGGGTTNIKHLQVTLTSSSGVSELDKNITLHAFSCNIGSYELEER